MGPNHEHVVHMAEKVNSEVLPEVDQVNLRTAYAAGEFAVAKAQEVKPNTLVVGGREFTSRQLSAIINLR